MARGLRFEHSWPDLRSQEVTVQSLTSCEPKPNSNEGRSGPCDPSASCEATKSDGHEGAEVGRQRGSRRSGASLSAPPAKECRTTTKEPKIGSCDLSLLRSHEIEQRRGSEQATVRSLRLLRSNKAEQHRRIEKMKGKPWTPHAQYRSRTATKKSKKRSVQSLPFCEAMKSNGDTERRSGDEGIGRRVLTKLGFTAVLSVGGTSDTPWDESLPITELRKDISVIHDKINSNFFILEMLKVLEGQTKKISSEVREVTDNQESGENPKPIRRKEDQKVKISEGIEKMNPLGPIPREESDRGYVERCEGVGKECRGVEFEKRVAEFEMRLSSSCSKLDPIAKQLLWLELFVGIQRSLPHFHLAMKASFLKFLWREHLCGFPSFNSTWGFKEEERGRWGWNHHGKGTGKGGRRHGEAKMLGDERPRWPAAWLRLEVGCLSLPLFFPKKNYLPISIPKLHERNYGYLKNQRPSKRDDIYLTHRIQERTEQENISEKQKLEYEDRAKGYSREVNLKAGLALLQTIGKGPGGVSHKHIVGLGLVYRNPSLERRFGSRRQLPAAMAAFEMGQLIKEEQEVETGHGRRGEEHRGGSERHRADR
ncbi:hypothetical protein M5K25_010477 [Dendrobium thyrsiflorum]|uniref:Uncharacterized protein n=1 Tax=Dendrobium thyrsiflorum TaxID=117978 RepID=A0ABD0V0K2_DENTH